MQDGENPDDVVAGVKDTLDKFESYVLDLVSNLPQAAFKADQALQELARKSTEPQNSPISLLAIPDEPPPGISYNDWHALDTEGKLKWIADSTNTLAQGSTLKDDMNNAADTANAKKMDAIDNNTMLQIQELAKAASLGSDGTQWATMSLGDKLMYMAASYNKANVAGAQVGSDAGASDGVNIAVTNPTGPAPAVKTDEALAQIAQAVAAMASTVGGLVSKVDEQAKALAEQAKKTDEQIAQIARKSDDASNKLRTVVNAAPVAGDLPAGNTGEQTPARKFEPLQDTAMIPGYRDRVIKRPGLGRV